MCWPKRRQIAIPTDFPPYEFVGTDLKPQELDVGSFVVATLMYLGFSVVLRRALD